MMDNNSNNKIIIIIIIIMRATHNELKWKICRKKRVFHILPLSIVPTSVVDSADTFRVLPWISKVVVLIHTGRRGKQRYDE
jgi:hypothetical protein